MIQAFHFTTRLFAINAWIILRLPEDVSVRLPSRGLVSITGTIKDISFQTVLEPDGKGSHWFRIDQSLSAAAKIKADDRVELTIRLSKQWPEPSVPADLQEALASISEAQPLWTNITPLARWDWIRWIRSSKQADTRKQRIQITCDKLKKGERRPCCFNRNICAEPTVSQNGKLLEPREVHIKSHERIAFK